MNNKTGSLYRLFLAICACLLYGPGYADPADAGSSAGAISDAGIGAGEMGGAGNGTSAMTGAGNGTGRVFLSPSRMRVQNGAAVTLDVMLDFSAEPTQGGSIRITWDPTVFPVAHWNYATSTINDDPASRGTPVIRPGLLIGVSVDGVNALTTPGIMGTLTLTTQVDVCQTTVGLTVGTRAWVSVTGRTLDPTFGQARVGVGDQVCAEAPIDPAAAQMRGRCIGQADSGLCPGFPGWSNDSLFNPLPVREDIGILSPLAPHMARYCIYQRTGFNDGSPDDCDALQQVADNAGLNVTIEPSVMAVGVQGPLADVISPEFESHFFEQVGKPLGDLPSPSPAARLWVVSLDTSSRAGSDPIASHGPIIGRIVSELTEISTAGDFRTLALPMRCFDDQECIDLCGTPDGCPSPFTVGGGGFKGTPDSVAQGLHTAIGLFAADGGAILRMVFNMSLGWSGEFNTQPGATLSYRAFVDALKEASCLGTLVIAAAGNAGAGPAQSQGLLYPAAESLTAAPTLQECQQLGYLPDPADYSPVSGHTLVYAVGATRSDGRGLLTRAGGEPQLVAYGDHATALTSLGEGVLTGSSVSSAVASATAGLLWAYDLDVPPYRLMEILYESASDLGREADTCFGGPPCNNVRRLSVCAALNKFCEKGSPDCPTQAQVECPAINPVQLTLPNSFFDDLDMTFAGARTISVANYLPVAGVAYDGVCNHAGDYALYQAPGENLPLYPCPQDLFYDAQAKIWAEGQPEGQSCETCGIKERSPAKLYAELRADFGTEFSDPTLSDATLVCRDTDSGNEIAFRLPGSFQPGELLLVEGIDPVICAGDDLRLAFSVADDVSESPTAFVQQLYVFRPDGDLDGVPDFRDNCSTLDNPDQRDTNGDGYGNRCDPDLNDDLFTNFIDLARMRLVFFLERPGRRFRRRRLCQFPGSRDHEGIFLQPTGSERRGALTVRSGGDVIDDAIDDVRDNNGTFDSVLIISANFFASDSLTCCNV